MVSIKRKSGVVEINADYLDELANDTPIEIDDEGVENKEEKKAVKTLIPKEWQVDTAIEDLIKNSKEGFGYELKSLRREIEIATFKLDSDDLIIDADPPPSHEIWHLRDCDEYSEGNLEYGNRFRTAFSELKKCPTLVAMKGEYKMSMIENRRNRQAVLKVENDKEILYFDETWMGEQLLKHRDIDINSEQHVELLREAADFKIDMTIEKIADKRSAEIVSSEMEDFRAYLNGRGYKEIHAQDKADIYIYHTPDGYVVEFGEHSNIADTFALANKDTVITDQNGNEIKLEKYLKDEYHVDLHGNYLDSSRGNQGPDQSAMLADEGEHTKHGAGRDRDIDRELEDIEL